MPKTQHERLQASIMQNKTDIPLIQEKLRSKLPARREAYDYNNGVAEAVARYKQKYGVEPERVILFSSRGYKQIVIAKPEVQDEPTN